MYSDSEMSARNILSGLGTPAVGDTIVGATGGQGKWVHDHRFGDKSDGDLTVSAPLTLSRIMYWGTLTIVAGGSIDTNGCPIYCDVLDLRNAPTDAIKALVVNANDAVATVGGTAPATRTIGFFQTSNVFTAGPNGGTVAGTQGTANTNSTIRLGGETVASGAGGLGSSGAGGASRSPTATTNPVVWNPRYAILVHQATVQGGVNGPSGGSGGGDATAGGGGGGGGGGAGVVMIYARTILVSSANTNPGVISAKGGRGGLGGTPSGVTVGRGGGGAGSPGGGGGIIIVTCGISGTTHTGALDVSGGAGNDGGVHTGTGVDGNGSPCAFGGTTRVINVLTGITTVGDGTALGNTAPVGRIGAAAVNARFDLIAA